MAEENKIEVSIVLDDGSIQRGFVKMEQQAAKTAKNTESNLTDSFNKAALAVGAIAGSFFLVQKAAEKAIDSIKLAEKVEAVNRQFEDLAVQAGVTASVIREDLVRAADGLVDDTDLIEAANEAFIKLGTNAARLPEIFELARKAASFTGRDITEVFQTVNDAIASGQTRSLKQLGIYVDSDKAIKDYAKSLGTIPSLLSDTEKQQARLNAVLTQGEQKFKNIDPSKNEITNNLQRASVAFEQLGEAADGAFKQIFGGVTSTAAKATADFFGGVANQINLGFGNAAAKADAGVKILENSISFLSERLKFLQEANLPTAQVEKQLEGFRKQLFEINLLRQASAEEAEIRAATGPKSDVEIKAEEEKNARILALAEIRKNQLLSIEAQKNQELLTLAQADLTNAATSDEAKAARQEINRLTELTLQQQHEARLAQINRDFSAEKFGNNTVLNAAIEAENEAYKQRQEKRKQDEVRLERLTAQQKLQATAGFFGNLASLQQSGNQEIASIGKAAALAQATIQGYLAVQGAYAQGNLVGGPIVGAAFAAAAAIASAINIDNISKAGGGGGGGSTFNPSTGATAPVGDSLTSLQPVEQKPQSKIEVNIAGDVLDSQETGLRIVDLINNAFDQNGVVVTGRTV